jgi:hypothetical protein
MNQIELPVSVFALIRQSRISFQDEELFRRTSHPKQWAKDGIQLLDRDRLQANIGRVQQYEKECYQNLFFHWSSFQVQYYAYFRIFRSEPTSITVDELARVLISGDADFVSRLENALQQKGVPPNISSNLARFLETHIYAPHRSNTTAGAALGPGDEIGATTPVSATAPGFFLQRAKDLDESGNVDKALDLVYASVDQMLRSSRFANVDSLLSTVPIENYSTDILLTLLTVTYPAKHRIPSRAGFFQSTRNILQQRGEDVDTLLVGLD